MNLKVDFDSRALKAIASLAQDFSRALRTIVFK